MSSQVPPVDSLTEFLNALSIGASRSIAARYAGLRPSDVRRWFRNGKRGESLDEIEFYEAVLTRESRFLVGCLQSMVMSAKPVCDSEGNVIKAGDWRSAHALLETCRPELYAKIDREGAKKQRPVKRDLEDEVRDEIRESIAPHLVKRLT